ncbi:uncharacterized protein TNCV_2883061 [Trichonephila clavipes]|nr:uncharacterized protein TNCV_2883061 [Trichonephila clavipes]
MENYVEFLLKEMPDIKIDDNGLFEVERRLNAYLNSNKLEQLESQHAEKLVKYGYTVGKVSPNRAPFLKTTTMWTRNNLLIPEQYGFRPDLPPTLESGGNDKVGIRKTKIHCTENLYLHTASSTIEIESQVRDLTSEILTAHEKTSKPVTHSEVAFVQGELKHLFKERNRARKLWQFTRHPQHKTELNRLQNAIKRKVNLYRQQVWEDHLTSLDTEDGSLWGTAKAFRKKAAPISALNCPTGTALSDTHKTEIIAQSLESQFQLNDIQNPHKEVWQKKSFLPD